MRKTVDATTHEYCVNTDYQVFSLYYIVVSNWLILFHCQRIFFGLLVYFLITQWVSESIDELKRASFSREEGMTNFTLKKNQFHAWNPLKQQILLILQSRQPSLIIDAHIRKLLFAPGGVSAVFSLLLWRRNIVKRSETNVLLSKNRLV